MKKSGFIEIVLSVVLLVIALIVLGVLSNWQCKSKWERSGMAGITWGPIQGCLVKLPDGRWLPEERIREIDVMREPESSAGRIPK